MARSMCRTASILACLLMLVPIRSEKFPLRNPDRMGGLPPFVLWAWERPEDLRFINPQNIAVAFLAGTIRIRGERHSVMQAINRQIAHYAYHIGQIVYIAKHFSGSRWTSLSIPRRQSADFNARVKAGLASQR